MKQTLFPPGTPVCVRQQVDRRGEAYEAEVVGVVVGWEEQATGSWYAHSKDGQLHLTRLKLRKDDGELVLLVIDDSTVIAKLEAAKSGKPS